MRLGTDVDFADEAGYTALHHAVLSGFEDCVQELIKWGSDVNAMTEQGLPLNLAAQKQRLHVLLILLRARADMERAIAYASEQGHILARLQVMLIKAAGVTAWSAATNEEDIASSALPREVVQGIGTVDGGTHPSNAWKDHVPASNDNGPHQASTNKTGDNHVSSQATISVPMSHTSRPFPTSKSYLDLGEYVNGEHRHLNQRDSSPLESSNLNKQRTADRGVKTSASIAQRDQSPPTSTIPTVEVIGSIYTDCAPLQRPRWLSHVDWGNQQSGESKNPAGGWQRRV